MLVSKKSRLLPPPSDRILRSARAESKRLIGSGEESFEPITTSVIINIAPQIMEGSPPLNADSILERMASPVGGQPPPMEPVNPHPCYHPPQNVQPQYQPFHQHPGPPPPVVPVIDPMMLPRGLPILVPANLPHMAMPVNLPSFAGYPHEDPAFHVERFEEILISNLITRPEYYLIWFPNTLVEGAYAWYRSNATGSFQTWRQLQATFLQQFRPVTGQQQALAALTDIRQGSSEDITSYIRRFRVVCTRYVGTLLNDETIRHYFIQGFDRHSTRREVLSRRPVTTEDAINAALEVEVVDKEDDRMERRTTEPIPSFIPLTHRPNDFPGYSHQSNSQGYGYLPSAPVVPTVPQGATYAGGWVNIKNEIKQATDGIKEEFNRNLQSLTEQMAHLIQNPRPAPVQQHESGAYNSGVWCSLPGCTDRAGHPAQFCPTLLQQQYQAPRNQYQQQQQAPAHLTKPAPKPYQPPHRANQARPTAPAAPRPQQPDCPTCGNKHALGDCWIENNVQCGNCGGTHPTDKCRRPDRVDPMVPLAGNFRQQAQDNMRGARSSGQAPVAGPPNMYFDHLNYRQTQRAPEALQTARGTITLAPPSSSVVLRDVEPEVQQTHYIDSRPPMNRQSSVRVVLKSGRTTGEDSGPPALGTIEETAEDDEVSLGSSDAEMDFTRLNEETQHAAQDVRFDRESSVAVEPDEDEYQPRTPDNSTTEVYQG
jgi:hypothetical protein